MRNIYTILFLLFFSVRLFAITDSMETVRFTMDNGFPSNNVYMALQDHQGYLWFATDNGVVKYDGYSFKIFTTADGLPKNDVWKLYEDGLGRMFVSTTTRHFGFIRNDNFKELIFRPNVNRLASSYFEGWNNNFFFSDGYDNLPYLDIVRSNDEAYSIPFDKKVYAIVANGPQIYFYVMPDLIYRYDLAHPLRKAVLTGRTPYNIFYLNIHYGGYQEILHIPMR